MQTLPRDHARGFPIDLAMAVRMVPAVLISVVATLAAVAGPALAEAAPRSGGTLRVAIIGEPPSLDPTASTATITQNLGQHIFETLYTRDAKGNPVPLLLEKDELSADGKTYTLYLRRGILFHNGQEMTADDVVASLARWGRMTGYGRLVYGQVASVEALDRYTVRVHLRQPVGLFRHLVGMASSQLGAIIIPKALAEKYPNEPLKEFIGTGPFRFVEHQPDRYIRMDRWERYRPRPEPPNGYGGQRIAYVDTLLFIPTPDPFVRGTGVMTGEFDFGDVLPPDLWDQLHADPGVKAVTVRPYYWYTIHFNKKKGLFTDARLRRAVLYALDMDAIMRAGFGRPEFYRLGPEIAAPETAWYSTAGAELYNHPDPGKARQLLKEAGYQGQPVRWMATTEYDYNYNMSLVIKQMLEKVGFQVDLQVLDWATLVSRRSNPDLYDAFITGHPAYTHPALQVYLSCTWPGWWCDATKDRLVQQIMTTADPKQQQQLIDQLQALQWEQAATVKLGENFLVRAYRTRVKGYTNPTDWFFWNVWLDPK